MTVFEGGVVGLFALVTLYVVVVAALDIARAHRGRRR
jgi:hypothetical protein